MIRELRSPIVLTAGRFRQGGWPSFLNSLARVAKPGDHLTIRCSGFSGAEEGRLIRELGEQAGLAYQVTQSVPYFGQVSFRFMDWYLDPEMLGHSWPDILIFIEVLECK